MCLMEGAYLATFIKNEQSMFYLPLSPSNLLVLWHLATAPVPALASAQGLCTCPYLSSDAWQLQDQRLGLLLLMQPTLFYCSPVHLFLHLDLNLAGCFLILTSFCLSPHSWTRKCCSQTWFMQFQQELHPDIGLVYYFTNTDSWFTSKPSWTWLQPLWLVFFLSPINMCRDMCIYLLFTVKYKS